MKLSDTMSSVVAGCMTWGVWGRALNTDQMEALIHSCLELGITTFDHADIYGGYTTEADFGKAFSQSSIQRENIQLISKCGIQYVCDQRDNRVKHYNYDAQYIFWSVDESLKKLRTDYLDLLLLHRPSPLMNPQEIARAFDQLKQQGKVRNFGVSNFTPTQIAMLSRRAEIQVNQVSCSLTDFHTLFDGTLDDCISADRIPMAWSPLGDYFRAESDQVERLKKVMSEICNKYDCSESQLLLAWIFRHPSGIYPVVGTTRVERLKEALQASEIKLETEDWFLLLEASQGHKVP